LYILEHEKQSEPVWRLTTGNVELRLDQLRQPALQPEMPKQIPISWDHV
jgi:hypothetical protein